MTILQIPPTHQKALVIPFFRVYKVLRKWNWKARNKASYNDKRPSKVDMNQIANCWNHKHWHYHCGNNKQYTFIAKHRNIIIRSPHRCFILLLLIHIFNSPFSKLAIVFSFSLCSNFQSLSFIRITFSARVLTSIEVIRWSWACTKSTVTSFLSPAASFWIKSVCTWWALFKKCICLFK